MEGCRRAWMRAVLGRTPRIFDATIIDSLRQGSAFFAWARLIAPGGGVALPGNADRLEGVAARLTRPVAEALEAKRMLPILFPAAALTSFLWANRLFGSCAHMMAAVPHDPDDPSAPEAAAQAAEVNIAAARNVNRGLRSICFALAAPAALAGALPLALAATAAAVTQLRREFASLSRRAIAGAG